MSAKLAEIDSVAHKNTKIKANSTFENGMNMHLCLLQIHEFIAASAEYPMVFIKDPDTGEYRSVAMMGLSPGENLYYGLDKWQADYVPTAIQLHPWGLAASSKNPQELALCLDMNSALVNEDEGRALFDEDGKESEYLTKVKEWMGQVHAQTPVTMAFIKHMAELDLFIPKSLTVGLGENTKPLKVDGIYAVDHEALEKLSDEAYLDLRKRNYLPVIFAHLASLNLVGKLARRKSEADGTNA